MMAIEGFGAVGLLGDIYSLTFFFFILIFGKIVIKVARYKEIYINLFQKLNIVRSEYL